ncbi:Glycosyltransferase involved in cell wall bisynthesis [Jiangella alkaliphila]|uniref:Glycosyltransferase involved in cell wall bisynthesis n=2 Tax=Jiangella alkaliphila TaxID=419479 RepID=A0A1H2K4G2_9ACTN|nr:Glycosyltransferase involved in cell wall bisynthesis [Jiangella alkaliphila]
MTSMSGRVIYAAPDIDRPIGGARVMYRHVELLVRAGQEAVVWHRQIAAGATPTWFDSDAPTIEGATLDLDENDILVVPESFVLADHDPAPGCRKVIYNQNHFLTFVYAPWERFPNWDPPPPTWVSSLATLRVLERLRAVLPIGPVELIPLSIDMALFRPAPARERLLVWMPRKRPKESALLEALLAADHRFGDVRTVIVDGLSESETAGVLGRASVFVALGRDEGFGLPVAEALAAGCVVVGYAAGGGGELFRAPGTHAVDDADVLGVIDQVAAVLRTEPPERERDTFRSWVAREYPEAVQERRLLEAVASAREQPAKPGEATHPILAPMGAFS